MSNMLKEQLIRHEGLKFKPYKCTADKLTIGVGHNLDDKGLSYYIINLILEEDIQDCISDLNNNIPWWINLDGVRRAVLVNMCFNLGINRLLKFKKTLSLIQDNKFEEASIEMLNSLWAKQVGKRAVELSDQLRTGVWQ